MPKWDKTRDYYKDLELPASATPDEIKRQFKKLALKYHPDRNPGREAEVNPKFQIIQSAHEILTDVPQKRQYDEARRSYTPSYPSASGVRGNPWRDAAKAYPPPPRRQPNPQTRPTSGAQRYENFAGTTPRHARPQTPKDDPQFHRSNAEAWDHIRPNSTRRNAQARTATPGRAPTSAARDTRPGPAPVPPRTAYQKQKAEAAFGTSRKTGFTPRTPGVADEPPVTSKNYFTTRTHSNLFTEPENMPEASSSDANTSAPLDPLAQFKDQFMDSRQRTPYHTPGGEKTSLFDSGPGLGRSTSTRTPPRTSEMPGAFPHTRPRSSSPPRDSSNDGGSEDSSKVNVGNSRATNHPNGTAPSKASERYKPKIPTTADVPPQPATASHEPASSAAAPQPNSSGPSLYASQTHPNHSQPHSTPITSRPGRLHGYASRTSDWLSAYRLPSSSSEESNHDFPTLLPWEKYQRTTLDRLVGNHLPADKSVGTNGHAVDARGKHTTPDSAASNSKVDANNIGASSFTFSDGSNNASTNTGYKGFTRNSTENINTRFVDDEMLDDWQFKAGSASANEATTTSRPRQQSRNRPTRRQTPLSKPTLPARMPQPQETPNGGNTSKQGFSAGAWNEQIGPQHFEPQPTNSASTSPTRRTHLKKSKSFKMTAGTAAVVDDDDSEGPQDVHQHPRTPSPSRASIVPDAMDIDSPPAEKTEDVPKPANRNKARKYSIEPHREDWRAGDVNGVASKAAGPTPSADGGKEGPSESSDATKPPHSRHGGSEDTEEFRIAFSDFKKVEPFADSLPSGLKSFADLKSTLPFQSQPSEKIPLDVKPPAPPLEFPPCPVAPRLPPTMGVAGLRPNNSSFRKYAQDFNHYMSKWEAFSEKVLLHFVTRQEEYKLRCSRRGVNWLEDVASEYLTEIDQDLEVRKKYADVCAEHRKRVAEYIEFRDRVK